MPDGRSLVSLGDGLAILDPDFDLIRAALEEAALLFNAAWPTEAYSQACARVAQFCKHAVFPGDTYSYGNFRVADGYEFQLLRLDAVRCEYALFIYAELYCKLNTALMC
jgi:hypothetical protein